MQFWIRIFSTLDPGCKFGAGMKIPDPQHCRYYSTLFYMYSVLFTTASDAHNCYCLPIDQLCRFPNMK
jgi:hypothetical protein